MGTPARSSWPQRLALHADYAWRHGPYRPVNRLHAGWDARPRPTARAVRSELGGMSVGYAGPAEGLAYILDFTELRRQNGAQPARRSHSRMARRNLPALYELPTTDLLFVGTSTAQAQRLPAQASLVLPVRVHFVVDLDADGRPLNGPVSKRERWQFNRDRRHHGWSWTEPHEEGWFDEFYHDFYRPTMQRRHGEREHVESARLAYECLYRKGRIFALTEDGVRIGGALCHWQSGSQVLTVRLLGVRDGAEEQYRRGAFKALYHYLLHWAAENGVRRIDFQGADPFLSAGVYQWKRRFGTRVILPPNHFGHKRLWLQVRRDTPQVRDFLTANPMLAETATGTLEAVYFCDRSRPPRRDYSAKSAGIERTREIDLDEFLYDEKYC